MKEIIENIKENADELKSKEVLNEVECAGYDVEALGLGFDIEKEYLK